MESNATQIQIIDENGNLKEDFKQRIKETDMAKFGKDYHIVSIIGNQSTGKSTLLNKLFGTQFDVMDASRVRKQTTKGILISRDHEKNIMILDVEGADSKERWDGHEPFEQCTALFSLVLSQVLMVNIFTQEVGRFTGSNYGVLKVIFENNLKLFKQEGSKRLIFILRDYDESENKETIQNTILEDVYRIWSEIVKPKELAASRPEQYFQFEFVFLTSFKWVPKVFTDQVTEFRQRFVDSEATDYFFKHHDTSANVPIDGLYLFMENVWTTIKECKDINLPNQKTLVANLRCTDIKNDIINVLSERINALKKASTQNYNEAFGLEGGNILNNACELYDHDTENYDKTVVAEKRKELRNTILQSLYEAFEAQISIVKKKAVQDINSRLNELKVNPDNLGNLMQKIKSIEDDVSGTFRRAAEKAVIPNSEWNIDLTISEVDQQIQETISMFREKQLAYILKQKATLIRREVEAETVRLFNNLDNNFWVVLENFYVETMRTTENALKNMLSEGFSMKNELVDNQIKLLNEDAYKDLESDIKNRFHEIQHFMVKKFRNIFTKNENGIPINWKTLKPEEIQEKYIEAKKICTELLQKLKYFNIRKRGEDYLEKRTVIPEKEFEMVANRLNEDYEFEFHEAERKRAASNVGAIPKWFWFVLIFFMYDDVLQWFKNPIILGALIYPLFIVGVILGLGFATGYGPNMMSMFSSLTGVIRILLGAQLKKIGINI